MPSHNEKFERQFGHVARMIPDGGRFYTPVDQDPEDTVLYIPDSTTDAELARLMQESVRQKTDLVRPICRVEKLPPDIIY